MSPKSCDRSQLSEVLGRADRRGAGAKEREAVLGERGLRRLASGLAKKTGTELISEPCSAFGSWRSVGCSPAATAAHGVSRQEQTWRATESSRRVLIAKLHD